MVILAQLKHSLRSRDRGFIAGQALSWHCPDFFRNERNGNLGASHHGKQIRIKAGL